MFGKEGIYIATLTSEVAPDFWTDVLGVIFLFYQAAADSAIDE